MPRPSSLALLATIAAVGGCASTSKPVPARRGAVDLRVGEYTIRPQVVSVPAGVIALSMTDVGILTHVVRVIGPAGGPDAGRDQGGTPIAQPGDTVHAPPMRLAPGRYSLVDTLSNHAVLGDSGTLVVTR